MNDERHEPMRNNDVRPDEQQRPGTQGQAGNPAQRRGPFTYAAGWLGTAFDRSRVGKREAEERRSRNM